MRLFLLVLAMTFVQAAQAQDKTSCTCSHSPDPIEALADFDPVFVGTVDKIVVDPTGDHYQDVDMTVLRSFGDTSLRRLEKYRVITGGGCGIGCGYCDFEEDRLFVVYVNKQWVTEFDKPLVSLCSNTKPIEEALADLEAFGATDILEPSSKAQCGGPDNMAAVQSTLFVFLLVGLQRFRAA